MSRPLDWTTLPLAGDGRSLVEASAGTGKTWTITALYLRLLLQEGFAPRQIIVSTFTQAAAAELAERLSRKLRWALAESRSQRADHGDEDREEDGRWLHRRWREQPTARQADERRLQAALAEFDAAPISTLHALCSRILADHPFAAGARFRAREMIDGKSLVATLVDDLWRVIAQGEATDELVLLARAAGINRNALKKYVPALLQPNVVPTRLDPAEVRQRVGEAVGELATWVSGLRAVLRQPGLLRAGGKLVKAWTSLADALDAGDGSLADVLWAHRDALSEASGLKGVNAAGKTHAGVLKLVEDSAEIVRRVPVLSLDLAGSAPLRDFLTAAQHWCRTAMQARLDAANQSSFDQLLMSVHEALKPCNGQRALADALFAAWPVALVDEFQDTDPVQFGILDAIYRDAHGVPRGRLVMIGDPKQAIYRFRGGDVEAYERARRQIPDDDRLALDTNHRSSRGYVEAINQFYTLTGSKLGPASSQTTIEYQAVQASGRRDARPLQAATGDAPLPRPLVLHRIAPDDDAPDLEAHALRVCAGQIVWALSQSGYRVSGKALRPGDIAVLLPSNAQAAKLAAMLKTRGVPCVTGSQKSVFDTGTARDLRLVLHAVLHPDDPRALRAALATGLGGASLGALHALRHDAVAWDEQASRFHALHGTLERGGPLALVAALLEQHAARLLETVEGERRLTDLRHLGELLQEAWLDCGSGERLAQWFADQILDGSEGRDATEARALRLESDAERVRLMTLHASKGLEFGVVFLPLMWKHTRPKPARDAAQLLASADSGVKHLVMGPARGLVELQEFEERFRMLYVALTRAIHACHVLLLSQGDDLADAIGKAGKLKDVPLNSLDLSALDPRGPGHIQLIEGWNAHPGMEWRGAAVGASVRAARSLPPPASGPLPMRHSFTTLAGGGARRATEEEGAAADEVLVEALALEEDDQGPAVAPGPVLPTFHAELDALAAVGGADFGNAVHALFEHRLAGRPIAQEAVLSVLREYGVRPREGEIGVLAAPLARRLQAVLETPLGDQSGPCLGQLQARDQRAELEFNYVLDGTSLRALRDACEARGEIGLVPRREQRLAGLMNGKIDLVFAHGGRLHLLDYKGNQLAGGPRPCLEDYAPQALQTQMLAAGYRFQALLYTLALERYLRERLGQQYRRDQHLGDCWYLFIRAVGLSLPDGTRCGVWRHRFDDDLLDAAQAVLGDAQRVAA